MASSKTNFETSLNELETIVARLESGDCPLDESIELFEKGMKLSSDCAKQLETARQKIIMLTEAENGSEAND